MKERWDLIVKEYTEKGAYAQTELRIPFLKTKCRETDNVREFMDKLRTKREGLATVGVEISEKHYYRSTIIGSLPHHLSNFASSQLASARLLQPNVEVSPDALNFSYFRGI